MSTADAGGSSCAGSRVITAGFEDGGLGLGTGGMGADEGSRDMDCWRIVCPSVTGPSRAQCPLTPSGCLTSPRAIGGVNGGHPFLPMSTLAMVNLFIISIAASE